MDEMAEHPTVKVHRDGKVLTVSINRPEVKNAVDGPTAHRLAEVFREFDGDTDLSVVVLTGAGGCFCAGADLKALARAFAGGTRPSPTRSTRTSPRTHRWGRPGSFSPSP
jgi:enoyl-CoA hydratase